MDTTEEKKQLAAAVVTATTPGDLELLHKKIDLLQKLQD